MMDLRENNQLSLRQLQIFKKILQQNWIKTFLFLHCYTCLHYNFQGVGPILNSKSSVFLIERVEERAHCL